MKAPSLLLITVFAVTANLAYAKDSETVKANTAATQMPIKSKNRYDDDRYAAYKVDGIASASKLAAQRSHTVAGQDERNFAIFTGITVILIVYFFSQFNFFGK